MDQRRAAGEVLAVEQAGDRHLHIVRIADIHIAIGISEARAFGEEVPGDGIVLAELGNVEALELREDHQHGDAARRGRAHRADLVAAIAAAQHRTVLGGIGGEVARGHL
jgi:hypothetical protein